VLRLVEADAVAARLLEDAAVPAARVAAQADVDQQHRVLPFLQFQPAGKLLRVLSLLPSLKLLPDKVVAEARLLPRARPPGVEEGVPVVVAGELAVVALRADVEVPAVVADVAVVQRRLLRFRAWKSSTCCWRPVWM
jgi:hypothetical protein